MSFDKSPKTLIRADIQSLGAYHVPDSAGMLKLDAMENPYSLPDALQEQWAAVLAGPAVNRYPDPRSPEVGKRLREVMNIGPDLDILLGNGSDELIQMIMLAITSPERVVMAPEPGFVMYSMLAGITGMKYQDIALQSDFSLDLEGTLYALRKNKPAVLFLAQPNNPTGNLFPVEHVRALVETAPGLVVIDEAYTPFCDSDYLPLASEFDNVLIMRTFSKVGLAGLRLGFLIGRPGWLEQFDKVRLPYNISSLTQAGAAFALEHFDAFREQATRIRADREVLVKALQETPGLEVFPSEANFVLVRTFDMDAPHVYAELVKRGVLIKCLDAAHPLLRNCLRITVGTPEENSRCVAALREIL
jgi:histidinol-phosphate aminotransferase